MGARCYTCDARPSEVKLGHVPVCSICYGYYRSEEPLSAEQLSFYSAQTSEEERLKRQVDTIAKQRDRYFNFINKRGLLEELFEGEYE